MKNLLIVAVVLVSTNLMFGQKYFTKEGDVSFYSEAPMEKIEAHNERATAILDTESGAMEMAVLIKSFQFEKALMQEHFNENYMESTKYPKAIFKGEIKNLESVDFRKDGKYDVTVSGDMTIHGVTQTIETPATFEIGNGKIIGASTFVIACKDYDIKIPNVVAENIAKEIEVKIDIDLQPLNQ